MLLRHVASIINYMPDGRLDKKISQHSIAREMKRRKKNYNSFPVSKREWIAFGRIIATRRQSNARVLFSQSRTA